MNNSNGEILLWAIVPGSLVTIRTPAGAMLTGRAIQDARGAWTLRPGHGRAIELEPAAIIRITAP